MRIHQKYYIRQWKYPFCIKSNTIPRKFVLINISIFHQFSNTKQRISLCGIITQSKLPQIYLKGNINIYYLSKSNFHFTYLKHWPPNFTPALTLIWRYSDGARLLSDQNVGLILSSDTALDFHAQICSVFLIFLKYL